MPARPLLARASLGDMREDDGSITMAADSPERVENLSAARESGSSAAAKPHVVKPGRGAPPAAPVISERAVVLLVAAVQFVNILDFMMVMPLGPDFARDLGIPTSHIGYLGGSYTASAAVAGLAGSLILDRFDRRRALAVTMLGLVVATAIGGFATGFGTLVGARLLAGAFGGPATSVALAIVSDTVPPERRGRALGTVMTAFSLASILGVPAGLELARLFDWRAPFFAVAALGLVVTVGALLAMPSLAGQRQRATQTAADAPLFDTLTFATLANVACVMLGVFAVVPNISTFLQHNLGYPREQLGVLYLIGGLATFFATRGVGTLVDRFGATLIVALGTLVFVSVLFLGFVRPLDVSHVIWLFPLLMLSASLRGVPMNTLASRVPAPYLRGRFMSAQSAVQHLASAAGALLASVALEADASGRLVGMDRVAVAAIAVALIVPILSAFIERRVKLRESTIRAS